MLPYPTWSCVRSFFLLCLLPRGFQTKKRRKNKWSLLLSSLSCDSIPHKILPYSVSLELEFSSLFRVFPHVFFKPRRDVKTGDRYCFFLRSVSKSPTKCYPTQSEVVLVLCFPPRVFQRRSDETTSDCCCFLLHPVRSPLCSFANQDCGNKWCRGRRNGRAAPGGNCGRGCRPLRPRAAARGPPEAGGRSTRWPWTVAESRQVDELVTEARSSGLQTAGAPGKGAKATTAVAAAENVRRSYFMGPPSPSPSPSGACCISVWSISGHRFALGAAAKNATAVGTVAALAIGRNSNGGGQIYNVGTLTSSFSFVGQRRFLQINRNVHTTSLVTHRSRIASWIRDETWRCCKEFKPSSKWIFASEIAGDRTKTL